VNAGAPKGRQLRSGVIGCIFALHALGYVAFGILGWADPFELFNLLLLVANAIAGAMLLREDRDLLVGAGVMVLILAHAFVGHGRSAAAVNLGYRLAPDELTSGATLLVNILILYVGVQVNRYLPLRHWVAFVASYLALFILFVEVEFAWWPDLLQRISMDNAEPLFLLFLMGLAACARSLRLLAYFWVLTLSFTAAQPYAWEALAIGFLVLTALFGARRAVPSAAAQILLGAGLAVLMLVLLPVVIVLFGEDMRNLELMLRDERVLRAISTTAWTATVATGALLLFVVPLAYGLSRTRFPGRTLVLSLMDLPIVIPQSVAGIALLQVWGRNQPLGAWVENLLGVPVDGTAMGICLAQIFVAMPFLARSALAAFDHVDPALELSARTLGASSWGAFGRVALPLAGRGIFLGAVLAWARAAGEFGAVVLLAPYPETAPVAAYNRFHAVGLAETAPLVALLLIFSLAMFFLLQLAVKLLPTGRDEEAGGWAP
jgi:molybdate/tungstate transport system permease protein